jgi:hypothetical protein
MRAKKIVPRTVALMVLALLIGTTPVVGQTFRTVQCSWLWRTINTKESFPCRRLWVTVSIRLATFIWGAAFGVKTYFRASSEWELISSGRGPRAVILDRCTFRHRKQNVFLVADAYKGSHIRDAVIDFLSAAAGANLESLLLKGKTEDVRVWIGGASDLVAYVGHDAFMDFQIPLIAGKTSGKPREAVILACTSKAFIAPYLRQTGAEPLLWTTGLMAPEAYTLKAALDGWIASESHEQIRLRSAQAYDKYQKCGARAA